MSERKLILKEKDFYAYESYYNLRKGRVCMCVCPSTPPTVMNRSSWNFAGVLSLPPLTLIVLGDRMLQSVGVGSIVPAGQGLVQVLTEY